MFAAARKGDPLTHDLLVPSGIIAPPIIGPCPAGLVIIEGLPAAHVTCSAVCVGTILVGVVHPPPPGPPPPVLSGSLGVLIHNKPAARWAPSGDIAACGSFLGDMKLLPMRRVFIGGISIGAAAPSTPTPPSAFDEFSNWVGNLFRPADAQVELYGNGITIQGTPEFRAQARYSLDMLNRLPSGSQLMTNLANSGKSVKVTETKQANGYAKWDDFQDAQNGKGTDVTVSWNPNLHELYPGGAVKDKPGSTVILGHEMVHASHMADGTAPLATMDRGSYVSEERATVGTGGTSYVDQNGNAVAATDHSHDSPTENSIRDDLGIKRRQSYLNPNVPGGAAW